MHQLWAIIDNKGGDIIGMVMTVKHRAEVERIVCEALESPRNVLRKYPQDFTLRHLCTLEIIKRDDGTTATIISDETEEIAILDLAQKVEINYQAAKEAEEAERNAMAAYQEWAASKPGEKPGIISRLMGGNKK